MSQQSSAEEEKKTEAPEPEAQATPSAAESHKTDSPEKIIESLKAEIEQLKDARLRLMAEFDNFRKRSFKEQMSMISAANEDLIKTLIPVLENFERALSHDLDKKGVELIYQQYQDALKKAGLTEQNPVGEEFDSEKHEALMQVASVDVPEHKIVQVFQKGYLLNGKVVQFAKVSVSKGNS